MKFKPLISTILLMMTLPVGGAVIPGSMAPATALTSLAANTIASEITVRIDGPKGGSGVIVEKRGDVYYVLTNWHVINQVGDYQVVTPDGKSHPVYYSLVRQLPGIDLAVVPFESRDRYQVVEIETMPMETEGKVYVAGWPRSGGSLQQRIFFSSEGEITGRQPAINGYTLVYSNLVRSGMSGGPVLNAEGKLVAINGIVKLQENTDQVVSAGIEIGQFLKWRSQVTLPTIPRHPGAPTVTPSVPVSDTPAPTTPPRGTGFTLAQGLEDGKSSISSLAIAGELIISGNSQGEISLWNVTTGQRLQTVAGHSQGVNAVVISRGGEVLASGGDDRTIKVWSVNQVIAGESSPQYALTGHEGAVVALAISPDGKTLVSGSWDNSIKVWDLTTGQLRQTLTGHAGLVSSVAISPDGRLLVSGSRDNTLRIWELATGQLMQTLKGHSLSVLSVAISANNQTLVSSSGDGTIGIWDLTTGTLKSTLKGHTDGVWSVAISADDRTLVSGSWDKTVRVWELATGQLLGVLPGHTAYVNTVAISGDGRVIVSGGWDGELKIWRQ